MRVVKTGIAVAVFAAGLASLSWGGSRAIASEPVTIAGYPLGQPFTMPQCPRNKYGVIEAKKACWAKDDPSPIRNNVFGFTPPIGHNMFVVVREGILVAIGFDTNGLQDQDYVMSQLRDKFGPPISLTQQPMQNYFGMKFDSYLATWENSQVYVEFRSVEDKIDMGIVNIETPEEHARRLQLLQRSQPPKL